MANRPLNYYNSAAYVLCHYGGHVACCESCSRHMPIHKNDFFCPICKEPLLQSSDSDTITTERPVALFLDNGAPQRAMLRSWAAPCEACGEPLFPEHDEVCHNPLVMCPSQCGEAVRLNSVRTHVRQHKQALQCLAYNCSLPGRHTHYLPTPMGPT